eukprot:495192-Amphidinium_carterae.1
MSRGHIYNIHTLEIWPHTSALLRSQDVEVDWLKTLMDMRFNVLMMFSLLLTDEHHWEGVHLKDSQSVHQKRFCHLCHNEKALFAKNTPECAGKGHVPALAFVCKT